MPSPLAPRFLSQSEFAAGYSPLYERLFALVAGWLADETDEAGRWLDAVGRERTPLDVSLLLMAGLHDAVLGGHAAAVELSDYYQTVGGRRPPDRELEEKLRSAVMALRPRLAEIIQTWEVQTNETGRGSVWLLPLAQTGWAEVDLVDLGASAGLNLVADHRRFDYFAGDLLIGRLGRAPREQFVVQVDNDVGQWSDVHWNSSPIIVNRIGCDQNPLRLETEADERQLMSFVWADQPNRLDRLKEGLQAQRKVKVDLQRVTLPDELPGFLNRLPAAERPLVLYNTVVKIYFPDRIAEMDQIVAAWAAAQSRPILWLQWEPGGDNPSSPTMAWTRDLWQNGRHTRDQIGWVHPHGLRIVGNS